MSIGTPTARRPLPLSFFFFNDTATTEIYTLSLHDALPIFEQRERGGLVGRPAEHVAAEGQRGDLEDRKSTRLNSSHVEISYAVFCLKKKKQQDTADHPEKTDMIDQFSWHVAVASSCR